MPEDFNAALLREVFRRRPEWSLVVIGPESPPQVSGGEDLELLKAEPNVHFLGLRSFESLPSYLKAMDVCTIPYRVTGNTKLADPLKLYEYLAAGKPIVSVPREFADDVRPFVYTGTDADGWIAAIEEALALDSPELRATRQAVAQDNTWDKRIDQISHLVMAALARRESGAAFRQAFLADRPSGAAPRGSQCVGERHDDTVPRVAVGQTERRLPPTVERLREEGVDRPRPQLRIGHCQPAHQPRARGRAPRESRAGPSRSRGGRSRSPSADTALPVMLR